ncbi:hypothetical protein MA16_Dca001786 [Dendrobium catenatum]|uniref:Uncharacterized protein n=1 Tax=Dendrobium catenatum TaxID=906689 RepID=A0A2I0XDH2_9ASPA|nr:hypothetical protein MA16_Dca001786 [Dendrobium catenatum]
MESLDLVVIKRHILRVNVAKESVTRCNNFIGSPSTLHMKNSASDGRNKLEAEEAESRAIEKVIDESSKAVTEFSSNSACCPLFRRAQIRKEAVQEDLLPAVHSSPESIPAGQKFGIVVQFLQPPTVVLHPGRSEIAVQKPPTAL